MCVCVLWVCMSIHQQDNPCCAKDPNHILSSLLFCSPQRLVEIANSENALTHKQMVEAVVSTNADLLRQRKSSADVRRQVGG